MPATWFSPVKVATVSFSLRSPDKEKTSIGGLQHATLQALLSSLPTWVLGVFLGRATYCFLNQEFAVQYSSVSSLPFLSLCDLKALAWGWNLVQGRNDRTILVEFEPQSVQENGFWHLWSASTAHMNVETDPARVAIPQWWFHGRHANAEPRPWLFPHLKGALLNDLITEPLLFKAAIDVNQSRVSNCLSATSWTLQSKTSLDPDSAVHISILIIEILRCFIAFPGRCGHVADPLSLRTFTSWQVINAHPLGRILLTCQVQYDSTMLLI